MTKLTKAEREELRKIASDFAAFETHIEDVLPGSGMLTTPAATALRALPRLLADLDAAEAERDGWKEAAKTHLAGKVDAWSQRDRAESERDTAIADRIIADSDAWVALGKPGGTHDTTCVQRLCEKFAEGKGERDALKAKLAEQDANRAGHPGMCCGQCVDSIKQAEAKLAALVEAAQSAVDAIWPPIERLREARDWGGVFVKARDEIRAAIAAARGGAS